MTKVLSENPAETTARARNNITSLTFPLNETMSSVTRLRFVEYNRFNPWDEEGEQTTATITLPLPIVIPENYQMNISGADLGIYGNVTNANWDKIQNMSADSSADVRSQLMDINNAGGAAISEIIRSRRFNMATAIAGLSAIVGSTDFQQAVNANLGVVRNPHTTVMFDGVNLRNINLEWRFSARSEEESRVLKRIQDTIKLRIHPEEIAEGFALNYPDLVYIEFDGKAKDYLPIFQKAFITNMNITPDSSGGMALYKSGAPVSYNFQISATELSIITRNTLQEQMSGAG